MTSVDALEAGEVQLRLAPLSMAAEELARVTAFLSEEELQRGRRLLAPERRDGFFAGRGILRERLAGYLGEEPRLIRLSEGEFGKPRLSDHQGRDDLRFNVSHAADYLLMAFAAGREVGIDLEQLRHDLPYRAMAERYFSLREREELLSLPEAEQIAGFYRCWTRKEAYMKATGSGFSQSSTGFDVSLLPGQPPALLAHSSLPDEVGKWAIEDVTVPDGYCAALAIQNRKP